MIGATVAIIGLVSGGFGGLITGVFLESYLGRRAQEEVGVYDEVKT
jgi:hypothetical protein